MKTGKIKCRILYIAALAVLSACLLGAAFLAVGTANAAKSDFKDGRGTIEDPFVVSTVKEFSAVATRPDAYFVQGANIDFTGSEFFPIGDLTHPFTGHYDGRQYLLSGICADFPQKDNVGVFAFIYGGAVVENVRVEDSRFVGRQNVGGVAGINAGRIDGAVVNADITANVNAAGGIAGTNGGVISRSVNAGAVTASHMYGGGLAGVNTGKISDAYNRGIVTAGTYAGGAAGINNGKNADALIERVFNVGAVNGSVKANIAGDNMKAGIKQGRFMEGTGLSESAAFNTGSVSASAARPAFEFKSKSAFGDWADFDNNFMFIEDGSHPILKAEYVRVSEVAFTVGKHVRMKPGELLAVEARVLPSHASVQKITVRLDVGADACTFENGILRIHDDAEVGAAIGIIGEADGTAGLLRVEVCKIDVERVALKTESGAAAVVPGGSLRLCAEVYPQNATIKEVKYASSSPFADVDVNGLLTVSADAQVGTKFTVSAISYDNVSVRDTLTLAVTEAAVLSVAITNTETIFKVTDKLPLTGLAVTESLETDKVEFVIAAGTTALGARIIGGKLYADLPGDIYIEPRFAGVSGAPVLFTALEEPVTDVVFYNANSFPLNGSLSILAKALPENATYPEVTLSIDESNTVGGELHGNVLTASATGTVRLRAQAGGITVTRTIYVEPASDTTAKVSGISLLNDSFLISRSLTLVPVITPAAAVANVYFELVDDGNTAVELHNGVLRNAVRPGIVTLKAYTADFETLIKVDAQKVAVENVYFTNANWFKISGGLDLEVTTNPANPTYPAAVFEILPENTTAAGASIHNGLLTAAGVGVIAVRASVDGVYSETFTVYAEKEPVTDVHLTSASRSFKHTECLILEAMALPIQATNRKVDFRVDDSLTSGAVGARIQGNILTAAGPGLITVIMYCDEREYSVVITAEEEPVLSIGELKTELISQNTKETVFRTSGILTLTASVFPLNATFRELEVSLTNAGDTGAQLLENAEGRNPSSMKQILAGDTLYLSAQTGRHSPEDHVRSQFEYLA